MISVNQLCQTCNEMVGIVSTEDSLDGSLDRVTVQLLNMLVSELNSQGYIGLNQDWVDMPGNPVTYFKKLVPGEQAGHNVVDREPPGAVDGVSRRSGVTYIPLASCDAQQMAMRNPSAIATSWNYGRTTEPIPGDPDGHRRVVGVLRLDGRCLQGMRVFTTEGIPHYDLDSTVYLPDAYNNMLVQGLCCKICDFHHTGDAVKGPFDTAFTAAKSLIKRQNVTQRMMQCGNMGRSYKDDYADGEAGNGW